LKCPGSPIFSGQLYTWTYSIIGEPALKYSSPEGFCNRSRETTRLLLAENAFPPGPLGGGRRLRLRFVRLLEEMVVRIYSWNWLHFAVVIVAAICSTPHMATRVHCRLHESRIRKRNVFKLHMLYLIANVGRHFRQLDRRCRNSSSFVGRQGD